MTSNDYAHTAYDAMIRRNMDGVHATLKLIALQGREVTDLAMRRWMDRTLLVVRLADERLDDLLDAGDNDPETILNLVMESDGLGTVGPIEEVPAEIAWAGRMFVAHIADDDTMRAALWAAVPTDFDAIADHIHAVLSTMVTTALAHAEDVEPDLCCNWHRSLTVDPMATAAKIAVAHLN